MIRAVALLAAALAAGCGGSADAERAGDRDLLAGQAADAVASYRAALGTGSEGRLWAKVGLAALKAGEWRTATDAYQRLATDDPTRAEEAADGLEFVARGAARAGDRASARDALVALRTVAPTRPIGRLVLPVLAGADSVALAELGAAGLAAAADGPTVDSLLVAYGLALQGTTGCEAAVRPLEAAMRRAPAGDALQRASDGYAACALQVALRALDRGSRRDAERWFSRVLAVDSTSAVGLRALVGVAELRAAAGDSTGAAEALRLVVERATTDDTLGASALLRLRALEPADTTDAPDF